MVMLDLISFPDSARVWVHQADALIPDEQLAEVHNHVMNFAKSWVSHNKDLAATGSILHNRFVVLVVDETKVGASGCSIDKSTHFLQALGHTYSVDFFNRHVYTYIKDDELHTVSQDELKKLYDDGSLDDETLIFDNLVNSKEIFLDRWVVPIGKSWIKRVVLS